MGFFLKELYPRRKKKVSGCGGSKSEGIKTASILYHSRRESKQEAKDFR
jgi:hypothetical protein